MDTNGNAIFEGLNPEQLKAVSTIEGPVLIVAGAGSGKTRVLTCRVANILNSGVPSSRVLALTFTKKAAGEMKERIAAMVGAKSARGIVMGTFHSVFIRFLRQYSESLGYPEQFTILDQSDSMTLIKNCLKELNLDDKVYKPKNVLSRISEAKNNLASPAAYSSNATALERDRHCKMPQLVQVYDLYWRKCRAAGVMDFDDILFEMNILLKNNPEALEEIASRFSYILVDEYQDTNASQYIILKKLAAQTHNICVVGDDSQSIYAFRGAKIQNILNFRKDYPESKVFRLEQNYRSTQTIVDAANSLIAHNEGRIPKTCFSAGDKGELIRLVKAYTDSEEAFLTVSSIADTIRKESAQYQDFAILYRTNAQSRVLEEALRKRNIPYMIYSGNSFYDRMEVKDLLAYMKLIVNPSDDVSFRRIVNKPTRGIGDTSIEALEAAAKAEYCSLTAAAYLPVEKLEAAGLRNAAISKIRLFTDKISEFNLRVASCDAYQLVTELFIETGIWQFYKSDTSVEGQSRFANVEELCNSVKDYVDQKQNEAYEDAVANGEDAAEETTVLVPLSDYLENIALLSAVDVNEEDTNKVALMTAHSSKGLEFPYVYIVGLEENLFPSSMTSSTLSEIEEERRLFYVAMTRAKKAVTLSHCVSRMRNGQTESNTISRFVREIDPKFLANPPSEAERRAEGAQAFWSSVRTQPAKSPVFPGRYQTPSRTGGAPANPVKPVSSVTHGRMTPTGSRQASAVSPVDFTPSPIMELRVGQRIQHNRFGFGLLREIVDEGTGMKLIIDFDQLGTKTLLAQYAKVRIVER